MGLDESKPRSSAWIQDILVSSALVFDGYGQPCHIAMRVFSQMMCRVAVSPFLWVLCSYERRTTDFCCDDPCPCQAARGRLGAWLVVIIHQERDSSAKPSRPCRLFGLMSTRFVPVDSGRQDKDLNPQAPCSCREPSQRRYAAGRPLQVSIARSTEFDRRSFRLEGQRGGNSLNMDFFGSHASTTTEHVWVLKDHRPREPPACLTRPRR